MTDLTHQYESISSEINAAMGRVVDSGQFILGAEVAAFEAEIADYCGVKYGVGVASGTDALLLALLACGVKSGDEVITTPFTFIATAESIVKCGARPVFVDIDPVTCNIDGDQIERKISPRTAAIVPVHLYGHPAAMETVLGVARRRNLKVIEDCAQALGAEYKGRKVGCLGDAGCLSFFPAKNLGAFGDGGAVVTDSVEIADRVRLLRGHGAVTSYYHVEHGFNSRLDALQAAILRVKLRHLERWNSMRRANAAVYNNLLSGVNGVETPRFLESVISSCNYYTVRLTDARMDRNALRLRLESNGIQSNVYYPLSLHLQEVFRYLGYRPGDFPNSELAQRQVLSLPMYPELRTDQIEAVASEIASFTRG